MPLARVRWKHDTAFLENGITVELEADDEDVMDLARARAFEVTGELDILEVFDERRQSGHRS